MAQDTHLNWRPLKRIKAFENDVDIFVYQIIEDHLPHAVTLEVLKTATATDPVLQQLQK